MLRRACWASDDGTLTTITRQCNTCGGQYSYGGTDREQLRQTLGDDAYNQLYVKEHGSVRHRLLHGRGIDEHRAVPVCADVYAQIVKYIQKECDLKFVMDIVDAPRRFDSLEWFGAFLKCRTGQIPRLLEIDQNWQNVGHCRCCTRF